MTYWDDGSQRYTFTYRIKEVVVGSPPEYIATEVLYDTHGKVCVVMSEDDWNKVRKLIKQEAIKRP